MLVMLHPSALLRIRGEEREPAYEQWLGDLRRADEAVGAWSRRFPMRDGDAERLS